ncbi:hypothetical protein ACG0Z6_09615 [Roseateles sp. BYS180W]|uniref:DUF4124 domain-containing protein n=1 Tax=Roseateles rivi TaxID=3299028 RepID=A0ABW7FW00_9BURK
MSPRTAVLLLTGLALGQMAAHAQGVVYRCPGSPVLYTDALSAKEAKDKGCTTIEGTPITVLPPVKPRAATSSTTSPAASSPDNKVDPDKQRSRDGERRRVLEQELRDAEERLSQLNKEYNGGQPERRGDERNYQKYLDRAAELKSSIQRQESDIQALKRELSKLPS